MLPDYKQHTQGWIFSTPFDFCAHPFSTQSFSFLNQVPKVLEYSAGEAALSMLCNCRLSGKQLPPSWKETWEAGREQAAQVRALTQKAVLL